jgi:beta-lactamase regulating signal transducer with metallopeptidase domain
MSLLIQYLVKLSISLAIVWLFYQFILRRLTFYNSNRWYLLAYTFLSFFIPFIDISAILGNNSGASKGLIQFIPSVHQYTKALEEASNCPTTIWSINYDKWDLTAFVLMFGTVILFLRFIVRYISFIRIRNRSKLISADGIKIYQVDESIIPFSFGKSVFINSKLHTEEELREIVRHEFVHVKQNHTIDIIWAELLCIINWYNPFAWLLKRSIRQNLEFIADNKVVENGIDKKQYQYLLLKVIGNNQYSIATKFNFSSLKKRIAMMNKTKSARLQVARFLFLVPVLAIILLAFRKSFTTKPDVSTAKPTIVLIDTIPDVTVTNNKGYYIDIKDDKGNCTVVIKDKNKKEVKRLLLTEWNEKAGYYENLYGEILSPTKVEIEKTLKASDSEIRMVTVKNNIATVTLNNGKQEVYTLSLSPEKKAFEERCGIIKEVAIAPTEALTEVRVESVNTLTTPIEERIITTIAEPTVVSAGTIADDFEITDEKAVMHLKNGKTEEYNLKNPKEREAFEKKFGKIISPSVSVTAAVEPVKIVAGQSEHPVLTTVSASPTREVSVINTEGEAIIVEEDMLFTITKKTTAGELESLVKKMKEKGYELKFTNKDYSDGVLTQISGTLKYKDSNSAFSATDFSKLIISTYRDGDKIRFKIFIGTKKGIS